MRRPSQIVGRTWPTGVYGALSPRHEPGFHTHSDQPRGLGVKIRFDSLGCCNLFSVLMLCMALAGGRSHPNAICVSLVRSSPTPAACRTVKVVLPSSTVLIMLCPAGEPDCYPGANTVRARFFGSASVLRSTVPCQQHRMAVLSPPPSGGTGGGAGSRCPLFYGLVRKGFVATPGLPQAEHQHR